MTNKNNPHAPLVPESISRLVRNPVDDRLLEDDIPTEVPGSRDRMGSEFEMMLPERDSLLRPSRVREIADAYNESQELVGERGYPLVNYWGYKFLTRLRAEARGRLMQRYVEAFTGAPYHWDKWKEFNGDDDEKSKSQVLKGQNV